MLLRSRLVRLFWPLAIWAAVLAFRTVGCKKKETPSGKNVPGKITYNYPTPQPTYTFRPGVSPVIPPE
jgi:hypothetical protein